MGTEQQILNKLEKIEREIMEIKEHTIDVDTIITEEERKLLDESIEHEKKGKQISLDELKNVRNKA